MKKLNKRERMYDRILSHGVAIKEFFHIPGDVNVIELCKALRRLELTAHETAELYCNGDIEAEQYEALSAGYLSKLYDILSCRVFAIKCKLHDEDKCFINGDPRGYALKIREEYSAGFRGHKDWGGYGIIAPDPTEGE